MIEEIIALMTLGQIFFLEIFTKATGKV